MSTKQRLERIHMTKLGRKGKALPSSSVSSPLVSSYRVNTELFWPLLETYGHRIQGLSKTQEFPGRRQTHQLHLSDPGMILIPKPELSPH